MVQAKAVAQQAALLEEQQVLESCRDGPDNHRHSDEHRRPELLEPK
jgi:hypothetical protein